MSKPYVIYSYPNNSNANKALIAAEYGGIFEQVDYPNDFKFGVDNKTEEFLKLSPLGKVPTLKCPEGAIFESNAIARYIARKGNDSQGLLGKDVFEQSMVDAWIDFASFYLGDIYPMVAYKLNHPHNVEAFDAAKKKQHYAWTSMERHFAKDTTFLLGERVTLADIIVACSLYLPLQFALDTEFRINFPKTESYLRNLLNQKEIKKVLGDVHFIEKFTAP